MFVHTEKIFFLTDGNPSVLVNRLLDQADNPPLDEEEDIMSKLVRFCLKQKTILIANKIGFLIMSEMSFCLDTKSAP